MPCVTDGVTGEAEADHLIDRFAITCLTDVRQPVRDVRRTLPSEPVLRRQQERRVVVPLVERIDQRMCDHQVAASGKRWM